MLVFTRKPQESIVLGDDIEVTVLEVRGDHVKIGITAPRTVAVHRKEVYEMIQTENLAAARPSVGDLARVAEVLQKRSPKSNLGDAGSSPAPGSGGKSPSTCPE